MPDTLKYQNLGRQGLEDINVVLRLIRSDLAEYASRLGYRNFVDEEERSEPGQHTEHAEREEEVDIYHEYQEGKRQLETYDLVRRTFSHTKVHSAGPESPLVNSRLMSQCKPIRNERIRLSVLQVRRNQLRWHTSARYFH
jgi:hypothetical protein